MINKLKRVLYFPVAYYFRFFAQIQLSLWKPRIIVITGSNSKTTFLNLLESQLKDKALYSHHANSSYGIPFNILGLERKDLTLIEWPLLFLLAPFKAFQSLHKEKIYVVEADCDRPGEGRFLASLLKPEVTLWLNSSNSHAQNFPVPIEENIAFEFGYFIENTSKLCIVNGDSNLVTGQLNRAKCPVKKILKKDHLQKYELQESGTKFKIDNNIYSFNFLLPKDSFYSIAFCLNVLTYLNIKPNVQFSDFILPPGRSSIFKGIKNTIIIDSSYNATPASMRVVLEMFKEYPLKNKWVILGDMVELGKEEQEEHEKLSKIISSLDLKRIILVGPRLSKYTYPKLKSISKNTDIQKFDGPKEALEYLKNNLNKEEVLLFKGARFLEGIVEALLQNTSDVLKLCRREKVWEERRKQWGV